MSRDAPGAQQRDRKRPGTDLCFQIDWSGALPATGSVDRCAILSKGVLVELVWPS
jgi:hypothetical protein